MLGFSCTVQFEVSISNVLLSSLPLSLSVSAGWLSAHNLVPDYSSGINEGLQEKLASVVDLVILNMALDHSRINLPLTYRTNDAHLKRNPLEEVIHPSLFIFRLLFPVLAYWSRLLLPHI